MATLNKIFRNYLTRAGGFDPNPMGPSEEKRRTPGEGEQKYIISTLNSEKGRNNIIVYFILGLLAALFVFSLVLMAMNSSNLQNLYPFLAGDGGIFLVIIGYLFKLWEKKTALDLIIVIIGKMTPVEAYSVIERLYYRKTTREFAKVDGQ